MWQGQQEAGAGPSAPRLMGPRWQARVLGAGRLGAGTLSFECSAPCEVVPGTVLLCPLCSAGVLRPPVPVPAPPRPWRLLCTLGSGARGHTSAVPDVRALVFLCFFHSVRSTLMVNSARQPGP